MKEHNDLKKAVIIVLAYVIYIALAIFVLYSFYNGSLFLKVLSSILFVGYLVLDIILNHRAKKQMTQEELDVYRKNRRRKLVIFVIFAIVLGYRLIEREPRTPPETHKTQIMNVTNHSGHAVNLIYIQEGNSSMNSYDIGPEQSKRVCLNLYVKDASLPIPCKNGVSVVFDDTITFSHSIDRNGNYSPKNHNLLDWSFWTKDVSQDNQSVEFYMFDITPEDYKEALDHHQSLFVQ